LLSCSLNISHACLDLRKNTYIIQYSSTLWLSVTKLLAAEFLGKISNVCKFVECSVAHWGCSVAYGGAA
jgi:hypothetical protein